MKLLIVFTAIIFLAQLIFYIHQYFTGWKIHLAQFEKYKNQKFLKMTKVADYDSFNLTAIFIFIFSFFALWTTVMMYLIKSYVR